MGLRLIGKKNISIVVQYLRIEDRLDVCPLICYGSIGRIKLYILYAVCYTAESKGLGDIGKYPAVVCNSLVYKRCESESQKIIKSQLRCDIRKGLYGDDIKRLFYSVTESTYSLISAVPV